MKFLHTADWQIGMKAVHVDEAGPCVRETRLLSGKNVIDIAKENQVEFILVAGDTFEDNGVDRVLVQKVADILAGFNGPVYIIPGNHDPLVPGSVWEHPVWKSTKNVIVLREEKVLEIPGGVLFPCPAREKRSGKDPTAWINSNERAGIKIGLAHGTVEGVHQEEPDYPIPRDAVSRKGLDYLALGHWHSTASYPSPEGSVRMAYSGTHETTKFGERDSGNVLIVEISKAGTSPVIKPIRTGNLVWKIIEAEIREPGALSAIREQIEAMESPSITLLELRIQGLLSENDRDEPDRIREILSSRFLFGRMDNSNIRPSPTDASWISNLPIGVLREVGKRLQELSNPGYAGIRPEGATTEVASRAILELYSLLREGPK